MKSGGIYLPSDDEDVGGSSTPPSSRPVSNYASPRDPPPIPFRPSQTRRWSAPHSPLPPTHLDLVHAEPGADDVKHVRFNNSISSATPSPTKPRPSRLSRDERDPFCQLEVLPSPTPAQEKTLNLIGLSFAAASGVLSGMSLVLAKAAVELLVITIDHFRTGKGENQFVRAQSWFLLVGLIVGGLLQLVYLNYSLTFASPALICPLAFCFFNLSSIFGEPALERLL
jgi:hypothetical protein